MVNRTVKKLRAELDEAKQVAVKLGDINDKRERELVAEKAKLEVYQSELSTNRRSEIGYNAKLEDQVLWMRNLIEALTIDPKVIYAKTDRDVRQMREEKKFRDMVNRPMSDRLGDFCKHGNPRVKCEFGPCQFS